MITGTDCLAARDREHCLGDVDVAILAGGLGTRISGVLGTTPKALATVRGRAFLDHVFDHVGRFGGDRVVLLLGHLADKIISHVEQRAPTGPRVETVVEPTPQGTGSAIKLARPRLLSDPVLVLNGDTYLDVDLCSFLQSHRRSGAAQSILCLEVDDVSRYGSVELDGEGWIDRFVEKDPDRKGRGIINGGAYLFSHSSLDAIAAMTGESLERDYLQRLPAKQVHGHLAGQAKFVDIGTPEGLQAAESIVPRGAARA